MSGLGFSAASLSLRERIAQLLCVRIGSNMPPLRRVDDDEDRVARLLDECPVGGLALFNGGPQTKNVLDRLQKASRIPLLVGSDIERGVGQQVQGFTLFPHAMALARSGRLEPFLDALVQESHDAGIHVVFGPVADVVTNPKNPIITIRAFSEDCDEAARLCAQYVEHCEQSNLLTCAKHFPGHGDTQLDSHDSLPTVHKTLDELRKCELRPFKAAIDAGCSMIMTAHIAFPQIDPTGRPATLSPFFLKDLLRSEMGFDGVICTDSLLMSGVRDLFSQEGEMALACLQAGVDVLLDLEDAQQVLDFLVSSVENGSLPESQVDASVTRVLQLKDKVFKHPLAELAGKKPSQFFLSSAESAATNAIELVDVPRGSALPFDPQKPITAILLKPFDTAIDPPEQPLAEAIRHQFPNAVYEQLGPTSNTDHYKAARGLAHSAPQLLIALIVRPAAWHAFGLRPEQKQFVAELTQSRDDVVLASLGVPSVLEDFPNAAVRICTYSDVPASQHALAKFITSARSPKR